MNAVRITFQDGSHAYALTRMECGQFAGFIRAAGQFNSTVDKQPQRSDEDTVPCVVNWDFVAGVVE